MNSKVMVMAALAICGCASMKEEAAQSGSEMVELSFQVPCQKSTKVGGTVVEDAVEDLQVFVFGETGMLQSYGHAESDELTLVCTKGDKTIAALVNAPLVSNVTDLTTLNELTSYFSENSLGRFVMAGIKPEKIEGEGTVNMPVSRLVSKVILNGVKPDFELEQHRKMDFKVKSVFLVNVPEDKKIFQSSSPTGWYNKGVSDMSQIISQSGDMMYHELNTDKLEQGVLYEPECFLYCYPNPLSPGMEKTYLVVEATLGQTTYYYSLSMPAMESNKCYSATLTICRPGSLSPDVPVEKNDAFFEIKVLPWSGNVSVDETI